MSIGGRRGLGCGARFQAQAARTARAAVSAVLLSGVAQAVTPLPPFARPPTAALRDGLVQQGQQALVSGDLAAAQRAFEGAAAVSHDADTELGLLHVYLQNGEVKRALAFAAHTAGAHRTVAGGTALYAWLLHLGGQTVFARRLLDERIAQIGPDPLLTATLARLAPGSDGPDAALLAPPHRLAPYSSGVAPPAVARVVGMATRIAGSDLVLVPATLLEGVVVAGLRQQAPADGIGGDTTKGSSTGSATAQAATVAQHLWLRDGLGRTMQAVPIAVPIAVPLAVPIAAPIAAPIAVPIAAPLAPPPVAPPTAPPAAPIPAPPASAPAPRLAAPPGIPLVVLRLLDAPPSTPVAMATGTVFPGSVAHVFTYARRDDAEAAWPRLDTGFLGAPVAADRQLRLNISVGGGLATDQPATAFGGPVFDKAGRWSGVVVREAHQGDLFVPLSALLKEGIALPGLGLPPTTATPPATAAAVGADDIYETALPLVLQVLSTR